MVCFTLHKTQFPQTSMRYLNHPSNYHNKDAVHASICIMMSAFVEVPLSFIALQSSADPNLAKQRRVFCPLKPYRTTHLSKSTFL